MFEKRKADIKADPTKHAAHHFPVESGFADTRLYAGPVVWCCRVNVPAV